MEANWKKTRQNEQTVLQQVPTVRPKIQKRAVDKRRAQQITRIGNFIRK